MAISIFGKDMNNDTNSLVETISASIMYYMKNVHNRREAVAEYNSDKNTFSNVILFGELGTMNFPFEEFNLDGMKTNGKIPLMGKISDPSRPDHTGTILSFIPTGCIFALNDFMKESSDETMDLFMHELENLRFQFMNDNGDDPDDAQINIGVYPNVRDYFLATTEKAHYITDNKYIDKHDMKKALDEIYTLASIPFISEIKPGHVDQRLVDFTKLNEVQTVSFQDDVDYHVVIQPLEGAV